MSLVTKPEIATNRAGGTVAEAVNGFIEYAAAATGALGPTRLDIATAYFNAGGYSLLADALDEVPAVRMLLGAEPSPPEQRPRRLDEEPAAPQRAERARLRRALEVQQGDLLVDRNLLGFTAEADASVRRLVAWLRSGRVEVRRLEDRFLHGKAFVVGAHGHGVMAGSSNFTRAGLSTNVELNLGNYQPHTVGQVQEWFDELWDEAAPYDLAGLFESRFAPHPPWLIFLRMLKELYGAELEAEAEASGDPTIRLTDFQADGLWRAKRILERHHGVLVADEVGLGKTFLAGELIREAALERRQRVLVVAPATLRDGPWRAFRSQHNLPFELVSFDDLAADSRLNPIERTAGSFKLDAAVNEYAMVVVDEAHNLRNPATQRSTALRRLLAGSPAKKLVLVTATPVNNSLWDLYWLLSYFLRNDAVLAEAGITSLRRRFGAAMALDPEALTPEHLFDVIDATAVRRTRSFVKRFYPNDRLVIDGAETPISFPTPRVRKVDYDLDRVLPGFFDEIGAALGADDIDDGDALAPGRSGIRSGVGTGLAGGRSDGRDDAAAGPPAAGERGGLSLARYVPSGYRLDGQTEPYEAQLAGLLRSMLLKRFESSPHAFAATCRKMAADCDQFGALVEAGHVATGEALAEWFATDSDDLDEIDQFFEHHASGLDPVSDYDRDRLLADVGADRDLLDSWAAKAGTVTRGDDPNLAALVEVLAEIAADAEAEGIGAADTRNRRKTLVFSYFFDTVDWITGHLEAAAENDPRLAAYRGRIATWSRGERPEILWGFAPATTQPPDDAAEDLYDILVTTDVLAEGVNLQQARHIVNYDLPWNPMRLVQRHGRIDRIGSAHREVFVHCVFPDARLDDLLGLEEHLRRKLTQAAATVGVGAVLPGQVGVDRDFTETREEIERLRRQEAGLFERGGTRAGALSGEEYRQVLRQALEDAGLAADIDRLGWGSGSGLAALPPGRGPGYVFCARVADRERPLFRYVELTTDSGGGEGRVGDGSPEAAERVAAGEESRTGGAEASGREGGRAGEPQVVDDTLVCLDRAQPSAGPDTARVLGEEVLRRAFDAWEVARDHIVESWNHNADPANLQPDIAPALRRAAELVRSHPPPELAQDEIDRAVDALQAPYQERVVRSVRSALNADGEPAERAAAVLAVIDDLGLEPYSTPEPLPEITPDDVHLVCWQALTAAPT